MEGEKRWSACAHLEEQDAKILVISHGGWIKEMINAHIPSVRALNNSKNCGLYILSTADPSVDSAVVTEEGGGRVRGWENSNVGQEGSKSVGRWRGGGHSVCSIRLFVRLYNDGSHVSDARE